MTPTVPLPPPHDVWTSCAQAYDAWGQGRLGFSHLIDGAIWLANGLRCPIDQSPHRVPVEVVIPPGQPPYVPPELAETGGWVWPAIGAGCALLIVGILVLVWSERRHRATTHHKPAHPSHPAAATGPDRTVGEAVTDQVGRHWLGDEDLEPNGGERDTELLAAVTGLGEQREPGQNAVERADALPTDWPDHRGDRDRDPEAPNPWRTP